jgi:hypothetical protein
MGGHVSFVEDCQTRGCPAHPYRFGKNPARTGMGASKELLKKARELRKSQPESIEGVGDDRSIMSDQIGS